MTQKKYSIKLIYLIVLIHSILLTACGGGSEGEEILISEIIIFVPDGHKSPRIDQTFQLSAVGIYGSSGNNEELTSKVLWKSNKPEIASVSSTGEVTTIKAGEVIIAASYSGLSHGINLTISPPPELKSVTILENENGYIISEDSSLTLIAESSFSTNDEKAQSSSLYNWASSDEEIATVDDKGRVIGVSHGEVTITIVAKDNEEITAEITATIKAKLIGISVSSELTYVELGENASLIVNENLSDGSSNPIPTLVRWFYDTPDIARITATGKIKTTKLGIVNATAIYGDFELTHQFIVENPIELFVLEDTGGFIKLAWKAKHDVSSYTLYWNNGGENEEDKIIEFDNPDTLEFTHNDIDTSKPYYYRLAFTRHEELSTPSIEMKVWTHVGKWQFRDVIQHRILAAGASYQENMYLIGGEVTELIDPKKPATASNLQQVIIPEVWEYNILKNKWTRESSLEAPLRSATACTFNEFIYVIGGEDERGVVVTSIHAYNTPQNNWQFNIANLPVALKQVSCDILNGIIYISGGHDGSNPVATTYSYDISNAVWDETLPALNRARYKHASHILNDKIYIAGGETANDPATGEVEVFDPAAETKAWTLLTAMETPRSTFALHAWDNKLHAIGGIDNNQTLIDDVASYDTVEDSWLSSSTMPSASAAFNTTSYDNSIYLWGGSDKALDASDGQSNFMKYSISDGSWLHDIATNAARTEFSAVMLDEKIYLIGGANQSGPSTDVRAYDTKNNSWDKMNSLLTHRQRASAVAYNDDVSQRIYVLGGINDGIDLQDMEMFNLALNTWEPKESMQTGRSFAAAALLGTKIYIFGGDSPEAVTSYEVFDIKRNVWLSQGILPRTRSHATAVALNSKVYLIGGRVDGKFTDTVDIYTPSSDSWEIGGNLNAIRVHPGATILNGRIYVFGGLDETTNPINSAETYTPFNREWKLLANLPDVSRSAQGGSFENKIYLISEGGNPPSNIVNDIYVFE